MTNSTLRFVKLIAILILIDMSAPHHHPEWWNEDFVTLIHKRQNGWKARISGYKSIHTPEYLKRLYGGQTQLDEHMAALRKRSKTTSNRYNPDILPTVYDASEKWSKCKSIRTHHPNHQGSCGSSWAIAVAKAVTDRICISGYYLDFSASVQELLTCCTKCGWGCGGGYTSYAWEYWEYAGMPCGEDLTAGWYYQGCKPYTIPECYNKKTCNGSFVTPPCTSGCKNNSYSMYLHGDKRSYGHSILKIEGEDQIRATIYFDGPVTATFIVHEDFFVYDSGVYFNVAGEQLGHHAVKLFGWGKEGKYDFWWAQDSWKSGGSGSGIFKILRGKNHCGIESEVVGGDAIRF